MKITKLLAIALLPTLWSYAQAQEQTTAPTSTTTQPTEPTAEEQPAVVSPLKNKVSLAATRVYNNQLSASIVSPNKDKVDHYAPIAEGKNEAFLGLEAGWYVSNTWRLNLSAGFSFYKNPTYVKKEGVPSPGGQLPPTVPEYSTIAEQHNLGFAVNVGGDRFFHTEYLPNLVWYVGPRVGFSYVGSGYNKDEAFNYGPSQSESYRFRIAAAAGADYYLIPEKLFVGVQVDPLSYTYGVYTVKPRPSLGARSADVHGFHFLGGPNYNVDFSFKVGLNF